jgi:hypothetical protein
VLGYAMQDSHDTPLFYSRHRLGPNLECLFAGLIVEGGQTHGHTRWQRCGWLACMHWSVLMFAALTTAFWVCACLPVSLLPVMAKGRSQSCQQLLFVAVDWELLWVRVHSASCLECYVELAAALWQTRLCWWLWWLWWLGVMGGPTRRLPVLKAALNDTKLPAATQARASPNPSHGTSTLCAGLACVLQRLVRAVLHAPTSDHCTVCGCCPVQAARVTCCGSLHCSVVTGVVLCRQHVDI